MTFHDIRHFMIFDISWHLTFHDSWHFMPFLVFLHLKFYDSCHLMTFNILLHFPRTNLIGLFPRGRFYPSSTIVFTFMCARHYFWTFGVLCIFGVFNNQLYYSTKLCFIDLIVVALWNRPLLWHFTLHDILHFITF